MLASLYNSIGLAYFKIKFLHKMSKKLLLSGPLWLFQHWLNAIFKPRIRITHSLEFMHVEHTKRVEGTKLALNTPHCNINKHVFMKYINLFLEIHVFVSTMALFVDQSFCPKWFRNPLPSVTPPTAAHLNVIWAAFLTPNLLSYGIETGTKCYGFTSYQPNLVARQSGISQM